ncbi:uncharacterized protein [Lolium perenne]|uniref:uncharacterized protein isoform X1 n=1 Tax=Lolium perenne TaxID=4522 RepID=UPI0021F5BD93|nr:uncharacterized protein LOC127335969 [Lolium perenne]
MYMLTSTVLSPCFDFTINIGDGSEMCAIKEVTLFSDDPKSRESAKPLGQVDGRLNIYLEYVSGGSIHKLLQEYAQLGEPAIRSYTQQILSGLAYLHANNTVHRLLQWSRLEIARNFHQYQITSQSRTRTSSESFCNVILLNVPQQWSFCNTCSHKIESHLRNLLFLIPWNNCLLYLVDRIQMWLGIQEISRHLGIGGSDDLAEKGHKIFFET